MPTARPRHLITETDPVARAIDAAAERWPEDRGSRAKLLLHLVDEGHKALANDADKLRQRRAAAIRRTAGALSGVYPEGYLDQLRAEWPE